MARSLGNNVCHKNACRRVEKNKTHTIVVDMKESDSASPFVITDGTSSAYLIVANDAVVMGKVYDHHATENLQMAINIMIFVFSDIEDDIL